MTQKRIVEFRSTGGRALTDLADFILEQKPELVDLAEKFDLGTVPGTFLGSGDKIVENATLIISYDLLTPEVLADIEEILEIAERSGGDITVTMTEVD